MWYVQDEFGQNVWEQELKAKPTPSDKVIQNAAMLPNSTSILSRKRTKWSSSACPRWLSIHCLCLQDLSQMIQATPLPMPPTLPWQQQPVQQSAMPQTFLQEDQDEPAETPTLVQAVAKQMPQPQATEVSLQRTWTYRADAALHDGPASMEERDATQPGYLADAAQNFHITIASSAFFGNCWRRGSFGTSRALVTAREMPAVYIHPAQC